MTLSRLKQLLVWNPIEYEFRYVNSGKLAGTLWPDRCRHIHIDGQFYDESELVKLWYSEESA